MPTISKPVSTKQLLIYLHIPKAAGTTLNGVINQQYSKNKLFRFDGINNHHLFTNLTEEAQNKVELVRGHFAFGLHKFIDRSCIYFTVLRHPVKRVISQYNYIRNNPDNPQSQLLKKISLKEYVSLEKEKLCNQQTRMICGLSTPNNSSEAEILAIAKDNLDKYFAVVGITEMFDETLLMLRKELGWKMPYYVRQNTAKNPNKTKIISQEAIALIEEYGSLDLQLYDWAKQQLLLKIEQQKEVFQKELNIQKKVNEMYQPFGKVYSAARSFYLQSL